MLSTLLRYAPVAADLDPRLGVLDVGCGRRGLSVVFDGARFAGQDIEFPGPVTPAMFGVRTSPGRFPWADGAFDTVVCVDTFERVPLEERSEFVAECARVAARRVLISCSTDTGADGNGSQPLPSADELARHCAVDGFTARPWPQVNPLLASLLTFGDLHPRFSPAAEEQFAARREDWVGVLKAARFGEGPRCGFELTRDEARDPLVDPSRFDASTAAALECVQCGTRLRLETAVGLRCVGCGCIPSRDPTGTWDLTRDP